MSIEVRKRPYKIVFSGNTVYYELFSAAAAADSNIFFQYRLMFKKIGGAYAATNSLDFAPTNGVAKIDVKSLVEGLIDFNLPQFAADEKTPWPADDQTGLFYLQYREITSIITDPTWDDTEKDYEVLGVKGALSLFKFSGNNYWVNHFQATVDKAARPFLTWQTNGRMAAIKERMYLAYLLIDDVATLKAKAKAVYQDGTVDNTVQFDLPIVKNKITYIPAGATQLGIDLLHPDKLLLYWEITVVEVNAISEAFRFYQDNRNVQNYEDLTLNYRNSLGGFDSVRIRGVIKFDLDYDFQPIAKTADADPGVKHYIDPISIVSNNKETQTLRGDVGHVEKRELDTLRDVMMKRETWWEVAKKWWPVKIVTKSLTKRTTDDTRYHLPLDFTLAHDGDLAYTPDDIALGEGTADGNVCRALLSPLGLALDLSGSDAQFTITGTEVDPDAASAQFKYRLLAADGTEMVGWTTKTYGDLPVVFHLSFVPVNAVFTLEARSICGNGVLGKTTSQQVNSFAGGVVPATINSKVVNNGSTGTDFTVKVNGVTVSPVSAHVGANTDAGFHADDTVGATITIELVQYIPPYADLQSGGVTYPVQSIAGGVLTFLAPANILGGMQINLW